MTGAVHQNGASHADRHWRTEAMDNVIQSTKSYFTAYRTSHDNGIARRPDTQPKVYEAHDLDTELPAPRLAKSPNASSSPAQPTVTTMPGMRAPATPAAPAFIAQEPVAACEEPVAQEQPVLDKNSFVEAARKGDMESVRRHLAAGLDASGPFNEAAVHYQAGIVQFLLPQLGDDVKSRALFQIIRSRVASEDVEMAAKIGALIFSNTQDPRKVDGLIAFMLRMMDSILDQDNLRLCHELEHKIQIATFHLLVENGDQAKLQSYREIYPHCLPDAEHGSGSAFAALSTGTKC
jgi:hypothetical protein